MAFDKLKIVWRARIDWKEESALSLSLKCLRARFFDVDFEAGCGSQNNFRTGIDYITNPMLIITAQILISQKYPLFRKKHLKKLWEPKLWINNQTRCELRSA